MKIHLGARLKYGALSSSSQSKMAAMPPSWIFSNITKIMSDISFPMCFESLNAMQVIIWRFEYKLTPKSRGNVFFRPKKAYFDLKKSFTWLLGVNLYLNLQMNACIVFSGSKHMGNDISLIILVISEKFQDGDSAAILDWLLLLIVPYFRRAPRWILIFRVPTN